MPSSEARRANRLRATMRRRTVHIHIHIHIAITITTAVIIVIDCMGLVPVSFCRKVKFTVVLIVPMVMIVAHSPTRIFLSHSDGDKNSYDRFIRLISINMAI